MSKEALLKYGLNEEIKFLNLLRTHLQDTDIKIMKTKNKFCCVDFEIKNVVNNKTIMLELKSRKLNLNNIPNFLISYNKLYNIKNDYSNCKVLLVWSDIFKNVFYKIYNDELLNSDTGIFNGGKAFLIDKNICFNGIDGLITTIKTLLL